MSIKPRLRFWHLAAAFSFVPCVSVLEFLVAKWSISLAFFLAICRQIGVIPQLRFEKMMFKSINRHRLSYKFARFCSNGIDRRTTKPKRRNSWNRDIYDYSDFDKVLHVSFAYACENSVRTARERETIRDWFNNAWFCIPKSSFQIPAYENPKPNRAYKTCLNLRPIRQRPISRWHHGVFRLPICSTIIAFQTRTVSPECSLFLFVFVITHVPALIDLWIY